MEPFLLSLFGLMSGVAAALEWANRHGRANKSIDQAFNSFKNNYVVVYSLMMGACMEGEGLCKRVRQRFSEAGFVLEPKIWMSSRRCRADCAVNSVFCWALDACAGRASRCSRVAWS